MKSIYLQLLDHQPDSNLVLATVTRTQGSTPQKAGSSALFNRTGLIAGTVGGGVVEGRVQNLALESIQKKKSGHFRFNLANDISETEEAICGGQISVLIDANLSNYFNVFELLGKSIENHVPGVLITMVTGYSEDTVLINRYWFNNNYKPVLPAEFLDKIEPVVKKMLDEGNRTDYNELELSLPDKEPSALFFLESVFPPSQVVIAGAGHIGKALAHLADLLDFEVTVIDDRMEFANSLNIPEADHIIVKNIGKALEEIKKTKETYVVIVTRGHKDDAAALKPCIGSDLAFIGMIGSKNKIASMRASFIENRWATIDQWDELHTPIGIDIKSRTVEEIAVSIAAQLVLIRNSRHITIPSLK
jgi:xanthine dehydrogenase accessory factor